MSDFSPISITYEEYNMDYGPSSQPAEISWHRFVIDFRRLADRGSGLD